MRELENKIKEVMDIKSPSKCHSCKHFMDRDYCSNCHSNHSLYEELDKPKWSDML